MTINIYLKSLLLSLLILFVTASSCEVVEPPPTKPDPDPKPEGSFELMLSKSGLSLEPEQSGNVTVTIKRINEFKGDITLSLIAAPTGVTGTFSNNPASGDTSELTISVDKTLNVQSYDFFIRGEAPGDKKATLPFKLTVLPSAKKTIEGTVVGFAKQALAGLTVQLGDAVDITDAEGKFSFSDIEPPYDITVLRGAEKEAHVFKGLSRIKPTLRLFNAIEPNAKQAGVSGSLSGGAGFPNSPTHISIVVFAAKNAVGSQVLFATQGPNFAFNTIWYGAETLQGTLHALQWEVNASGLPLKYTGYAKKEISLTNAGLTAVPALTLKPLSTSFISTDITVPKGSALKQQTLYAQFSETTGFPLAIDISQTLQATFAVPDLGIPFGVQATVKKGNDESWFYKANITPGTVEKIVLPASVTLQSPSNAATGIDYTTEFSWTAYDKAIYVTSFQAQVASNPSYFIYTNETSTRIPTLNNVGFALPGGLYKWSVLATGPYEDLDAFTAKGEGGNFPGLDKDVRLGTAASFTFTASP